MGNFFAITVTLFFIMDALGVIPTYLGLLNPYPGRTQWFIAVRELLIALVVMYAFYFIGAWLLRLLSISKSTLEISGGIIFFLIAIRLIFPSGEDPRGRWEGASPFIVPIAIPLIAGPSLLAAIMIFSQEIPKRSTVMLAIFVAWALSTIILLLARPIYKVIGARGLLAVQRLMGLILTLIAVQMLILGVKGLIHIALK